MSLISASISTGVIGTTVVFACDCWSDMRDGTDIVTGSSTPPNTSSKKLFTVRLDTVDGVGAEDGVLVFGSTSGVKFKDLTPRPGPAGGAGVGIDEGEDSVSSSHARKSEWSAFDGFEVCSTEAEAAAVTPSGELMSNSSKGSGFILTISVVLVIAGDREITLASNASMLSSIDDDDAGVVNGPVGCVEVANGIESAATGDALSRNQSSKSSMKIS